MFESAYARHPIDNYFESDYLGENVREENRKICCVNNETGTRFSNPNLL